MILLYLRFIIKYRYPLFCSFRKEIPLSSVVELTRENRASSKINFFFPSQLIRIKIHFFFSHEHGNKWALRIGPILKISWSKRKLPMKILNPRLKNVESWVFGGKNRNFNWPIFKILRILLLLYVFFSCFLHLFYQTIQCARKSISS